MDEAQANLRATYILKREQLLALVDTGVNIPPLAKVDRIHFKNPINDLLSCEINPTLEQMMPNPDDHESWLTFEGIYEDALDKIRRMIITVKGRDQRKLYGARVINPKLQQAREQQSEALIQRQSAQTQLRKAKYLLEDISLSESEESANYQNEAERNRKNTQWAQKIAPILDKIPAETLHQIFGENVSHQLIWEELNTSLERRKSVIEWLDSVIFSELASELDAATKLLHQQQVRESYNATKSIAMRRYVTKKHSPPCAIDKDVIHNYFQRSWATPPQNFQEAQSDTPFFLKSKIPDDASETMEEFMLNDKNIKDVINSRSDIGACGPDGINNTILKLAGKEGIRFMKNLIKGCITYGRIFDSWKKAKTILLFKKGDRTDPQNWRPISITNCLYRIFTCLMARNFQEINSNYHLFSNPQKGFIKKTNGCTEHGIILNELYHDAYRNNKSLVVTAIDFTNAFGSVPHELILSTMKQRNFPEWTRNIIQDMYTDASSFIELRGDKTVPISWKRGVKQGCPLSPLLFNLCLEPLFQVFKSTHSGSGAFIQIDEHSSVETLYQAYADDIALVSEHPEGIQTLLRSLEVFTNWSKMEVNVKKCSTASYLFNNDHHRCTLTEPLKFRNQDIPNLSLSQSMKYLGTAVAARRHVKLKATNQKFDEMKILVEKIMNSPLLTVQKIDAIKTFVVPCFDFLMLNGTLSKKLLKSMDSFIRGKIDNLLKIPGLPKECHHMSWRDGGFSIPSLADRAKVLSICSFSHMILSKDPNIRQMTLAIAESERNFRHIPEESSQNLILENSPHFLNWKDTEDEIHLQGTSSFVVNARRAVKDLKVHLQIEPHADMQHTTQNTTLVIRNSELELKTTSPAKIGRFLTQKIIRPALALQIQSLPLKGAAFPTLRKNDWSNKFLRNTFTRRSDAFFRFSVAARTDSLPTPANIERWYHIETHNCLRCTSNQKATLAHILNNCHTNFPLMTDRHNRVVRCVRKAIEKHITADLVGGINENTTISFSNQSDETRHQRPDIWFIRKERNQEILEILEFSCPYGRVNESRSDEGENAQERRESRENPQTTLQLTFEHKLRKYQRLAEEFTANTGRIARIHPVIVSSLGAVYTKSMSALKIILKCSDKDLSKLGSWISEQATMGSFRLWIEYQKSSQTNQNHEIQLQDDHEQFEEISAQITTEISLANQEHIDDINNDEETDTDEEENNLQEDELRENILENSESPNLSDLPELSDTPPDELEELGIDVILAHPHPHETHGLGQIEQLDLIQNTPATALPFTPEIYEISQFSRIPETPILPDTRDTANSRNPDSILEPPPLNEQVDAPPSPQPPLTFHTPFRPPENEVDLI
jgi:hypothetical protein